MTDTQAIQDPQKPTQENPVVTEELPELQPIDNTPPPAKKKITRKYTDAYKEVLKERLKKARERAAEVRKEKKEAKQLATKAKKKETELKKQRDTRHADANKEIEYECQAIEEAIIETETEPEPEVKTRRPRKTSVPQEEEHVFEIDEDAYKDYLAYQKFTKYNRLDKKQLGQKIAQNVYASKMDNIKNDLAYKSLFG